MSLFPRLRSSRLTLRSLSTDDAAAVFALFGSDLVTRHYDLATMGDESEALSWIQSMNERFDRTVGIRWAICSADKDELLGTCGFVWRPHNRSAILGYDIRSEFWGRGYATEASRLALGAAYAGAAPFTLNRVEAYTYPDNPASIAVLAKLGFRHEGLLRRWGYWKDRFHDMECFAIIREDWEREYKSLQPTAFGGG